MAVGIHELSIPSKDSNCLFALKWVNIYASDTIKYLWQETTLNMEGITIGRCSAKSLDTKKERLCYFLHTQLKYYRQKGMKVNEKSERGFEDKKETGDRVFLCNLFECIW